MNPVFEGKSKQIFETDRDDEVIIRFKDKVAFDFDPSLNHFFDGKAKYTSAVNKYMFKKLSTSIPHHYLRENDETSFVAKKLDIIPVKIVMRNFSAGSILERKGYKKGEWFVFPLLEYFFKNPEGRDLEVSEGLIVDNGLLNYEQLDVMIDFARRANQILWTNFREKDLYLVDVKFEFGRDAEGNIMIADEITPDSARIWLPNKAGSLDKDVFVENSADLVQTYEQLVAMLGV